MSEHDVQVTTAYGEAMLYAHLIEDLLRLHLYECAFLKVNGYGPASRRTIKEMKFEEMIEELARIYCNAQRVVADLHRVRRIRNHLTHAFVDQVGTDLRTQEGRDQIHAMLTSVILHAKRLLKGLQKTHELVLREGLSHDFMRILSREDPEFDSCVARSRIQVLLQELDDKSERHEG